MKQVNYRYISSKNNIPQNDSKTHEQKAKVIVFLLAFRSDSTYFILVIFLYSYRTVQALNNLAENLVIPPSNKFEKVKRNYAISLQSVPSQNFSGLSFSGAAQLKSRKSPLRSDSIATNSNDSVPSDSTASISIPRTIFNESTIQNTSRRQTVIFALYKETKFFRVSLDDTTKTSRRLNSVVIAGSIKGKAVVNLSEPVKIALKSIARGDTNSTLCSYWNFHLGNWSQEGCSFQGVLRDGRVLCNCDHLTNFAILMVSLFFWGFFHK